MVTEGVNGPLILYDGVCGLCNSMVRFVLKHDRKKIFTFAALQGPTSQAILRRHAQNPEALDTMYVVFDSGEQLLSRSDAAIFIGGELGRVWGALAAVYGILPAVLRNWIYRLIARNRYKLFGRYETCPLPDAGVRDRFLD